MELKDYTTIQLLDELRRRAKEAPTERKAPAKPEYAILKGTVIRVANTTRAFTHWVFFVKFDEEDAQKFNLLDQQLLKAEGVKVSLYPGKFRKDNSPKVGDKVIVRDRITKASPKFVLSTSRIMEVINE